MATNSEARKAREVEPRDRRTAGLIGELRRIADRLHDFGSYGMAADVGFAAKLLADPDAVWPVDEPDG